MNEKSESKIRVSSLAENGPVLPIGIRDPAGAYCKDLKVKDWTMKEETRLGEKIEEQKQNVRVGRYISLVLSHLCEKIGSHDFTSMSEKAKQLAISQMYLADVLFAYLWLRLESMGHKFPLQLQCPNCGSASNMDTDLRELDVRSVDSIEEAEWSYKLQRPFEIRGKTAEELLIRPPGWSAIEGLGGKLGRNFGALKAAIIHGSVHSVTGSDPVPLAVHEFDEMRKIDFESLTAEIDRRTAGPDFSVEASCWDCGFLIRDMIRWASEDFFGVSSHSKV